MRLAIVGILGLLMLGCAPKGGQIRPSGASAEEMAAAFNVRVFESSFHHPKVARYAGSFRAVSCRSWTWQPAANKGAALQELRLMAHRAGGDALINVQFDTGGTDMTCWDSVTATGDAVVLEKSP